MNELTVSKFRSYRVLLNYLRHTLKLNDFEILEYFGVDVSKLHKCGFCDNYANFKIKFKHDDNVWSFDEIVYPNDYYCKKQGCPGKKINSQSREFLRKVRNFTDEEVESHLSKKSKKSGATLKERGWFDDISNNPFSKEYWIKKGLSEEDADIYMFNKSKKSAITKRERGWFDDISNNPFSKEYWIKKGLSEEDAQIKVNSRNIVKDEFYLCRGFSKDESSKLSKQNAATMSFDYIKNKYDLDDNSVIEIRNKRADKIRYSNTIEGMMQRLNISKEEAIELKKQRIDKINFANSLEGMMQRLNISKEEALDLKCKRREHINKSKKEYCYDILTSKYRACSKESSIIFNDIYESLPNELKEKCYFGIREFGRFDKSLNKYYFYDFVISNIKFCIEYNGIKFHPKIDDENWKQLYTKKSYTEVKEHDNRKKELLSDAGFDYYVIWSDDNNTEFIKELKIKIKQKYEEWKKLNCQV